MTKAEVSPSCPKLPGVDTPVTAHQRAWEGRAVSHASASPTLVPTSISWALWSGQRAEALHQKEPGPLHSLALQVILSTICQN